MTRRARRQRPAGNAQPLIAGRLWAPWRSRYFSMKPPPGCLFCRVHRSSADRRNLVVRRGRRAFAMLNLYPYNNGHVMVAPARHVARLGQLTDVEVVELWRLAEQCVKTLDRAIRPHGYNLGMNLGRSAGAGIPGHVHLHVVPRWSGDTNFMPVTGATKVISQSLDALYRALTA